MTDFIMFGSRGSFVPLQEVERPVRRARRQLRICGVRPMEFAARAMLATLGGFGLALILVVLGAVG